MQSSKCQDMTRLAMHMVWCNLFLKTSMNWKTEVFSWIFQIVCYYYLFREKICAPVFVKIFLVSIVSESQIYCLLFVCLRICVVIKCKTKTTIKHLENETFAYFIRNFIWTFHMIPPLDWCLCHLFSAQLTRNFGWKYFALYEIEFVSNWSAASDKSNLKLGFNVTWIIYESILPAPLFTLSTIKKVTDSSLKARIGKWGSSVIILKEFLNFDLFTEVAG